MAGSRKGGLKAAKTNKARYGSNFYEKIGQIGGRISTGGGFAKNPELAKIAGQKGGRASQRKRRAA